MYPETVKQHCAPVEPLATEKVEKLSILVGKYEFFGPFTDLTEIASEAGVLAVLIQEPRGFELVELYGCENLVLSAQTELAKRKDGEGEISVAVYYAGDLTAEEILSLKDDISSEFDDSEGTT